MKKTLLIFIFGAYSFLSMAQNCTLTNGGFESNWVDLGFGLGMIPAPWIGIGISKGTPGAGSATCATLKPSSFFGIANIATQIRCQSKSQYLNGAFKSNIKNGDTVMVSVSYFKSGQSDYPIAGGFGEVTGTTSNFVNFHVPIITFQPGNITPDSLVVGLILLGEDTTSSFSIDNLAMSNSPIGQSIGIGTVAIQKNIAQKDVVVYPNPVQGSSFSVKTRTPISSESKILMTDIQGKVQVIDVANQNPLELQIKTQPLKAGIYFLHLNDSRKRITKKIVVQ